MTDSTASSDSSDSSQPKPSPSFWDDAIEIFVNPAEVFRRRAGSNPWPAIFFVAIVIGLISYATFNTLSPIFEAEFNRNAAKQMASNPQVTQAAMDKSRDLILTFSRYTIGPILVVVIFMLGALTWMVSKLFSAKATFTQGLVVAAWAYFPRILGAIIGGAQGLFMDPSKLNSQLAISLSPARFMNVETANPMLFQIAGRFDLITIWVTILLAIGVYVTGKITKGKATTFGILMWVLGTLPALRAAYMLM